MRAGRKQALQLWPATLSVTGASLSLSLVRARARTGWSELLERTDGLVRAACARTYAVPI